MLKLFKNIRLISLSNRATDAKYKVVLVRHGQSEYNFGNKFSGWADIKLTEQGILEAEIVGKL